MLASVSVAALVLTLCAYATTFDSLPLLEEIYLLDFLKSRPGSIIGFLTSVVDWPGPLPRDSWGLLSSSFLALLSNLSSQSIPAMRVVAALIHALNAILFFILAKNVLVAPDDRSSYISTGLAAAASIIFSIYPLAPEAVAWLGGLAYELGATFFLIAFYLYLLGKRKRNWTILGVAWISFLFAILCDTSLWSSGFIVVALELAKSFIGPPPADKGMRVPSHDEVFEDKVDRMLEEESRHEHAPTEEPKEETPDTTTGTNTAGGEQPRVYDDDSADNLFETLVPALPFIVLGVVISIRALPATGNEQLPRDMIAGLSDWVRVFKHLFFPINEAIIDSHANHYLQMYLLYMIPAAVTIAALVRNRSFRQNFAVLFAWMLVMIVPHLHTAISTDALEGSRFVYSATIPAAATIALIFLAPFYAFSGMNWFDHGPKKMACGIFACILAVALSIWNFDRTQQQNIAYKQGAQLLESLSKSAQSIAGPAKDHFVLIKGIPHEVSISDQIVPGNIIAFDGEKKLVRAAAVSQGRLKEALRKGQYTAVATRWQSDQGRLETVDFNQEPDNVNRDQLPRLSYARIENTGEQISTKEPLFSNLTYDYPNLPELGLIAFDRRGEQAVLTYDTVTVPGAHGCLVEFSHIDDFFQRPNHYQLSARPLKTEMFEKTAGEIKLTPKEFKQDGVYSVRIFATDKQGKLIANASDEINFLIYTRPRG